MSHYDTLTVKINNSLSQTCSMITSIMVEKIKRMFPKGFIQSEYVNTEMPLYKYKKSVNNINEIAALKQKKPILAISPVFITEPSEFTRNFFNRNMGYRTDDLRRPYYINTELLIDSEREIYIDYEIDKMKMDFEVTVILSTLMQQMDLFGHIKHNFKLDGPLLVESYVEYEIPVGIINELSKIINLPIYDENGSVNKFLSYLQKNSVTPIIYKRKNATGNNRFFALLLNALDIEIEVPQLSDGEKAGATKSDYPITFTIHCDFNYITTYFIRTKMPSDIKISEEVIKGLLVDDIEEGLHAKLQIVNPADKYYSDILADETLKNFRMFTSCEFTTDPENGVDTTDLTDVLRQDEIVEILKYAKKNNIPYHEIYNYRLYSEEGKIPESDYSMDWDNFILKTKCNTVNDVKIIFTVNNELKNNILKKIIRIG